MKLSVWSDYLSGISPEEKVKTFAECGYSYSEFSSEDGEELLGRGSPEKIGREFKKFADGYGISFEQGHLELETDILKRESIDALKDWIDLFEAIGVKACVLHYGRGDDLNIPPCEILEKRVNSILEIVGYIKGTDTCICLENLSQRHDNNCDNLLGIIKEVGSNHLGICLDTGHLHLAGGNPAEFVKQAGPYLKALHIADNEGYYDQHLMPYGRGNIQWEQFMSTLNASGYDGLFNFEIPGESSGPLEIRIAKLKYIKEMAAYMARIR